MAGFRIIDRGRRTITAALHAGHDLRPSLASWCALDPETRVREEDPYTDLIADVGTSLIVGTRSRFEVDLNRPRDASVYRVPEDAWGLAVWARELPPHEIEESLALYDAFYLEAARLLDRAVNRYGSAVVLDVHSYNHRREGPEAPCSDALLNPEVNLGTGTLDASRWSLLVDRTIGSLLSEGFDVRENVRFKGGHFASWAHDRYEGRVAVLALEFKKVFMDEWTGTVDRGAIERLRAAITRCVAVAEETAVGECR